MKFYGEVKEGKIHIGPEFRDYIEKLEGGFEIRVTRTKDIRTLEMNNRYWWWMSILSEHSGYTKKELHNYFKTKLLCEVDTVNGETMMDCESTSDLTVAGFAHYLQEVGRLAAQNFNFYLPEKIVPGGPSH